MARDDKGKKRRDRRALRKSSKAKKPIQEQSVPQEGSTLSNVVSETSVTDNTQSPQKPIYKDGLKGPLVNKDIQEENEEKQYLIEQIEPFYKSERRDISELQNKSVKELEDEFYEVNYQADIRNRNQDNAFQNEDPTEQLKSLSELPDADKELLSQDKNVATSLINDAASNPKLTSGEFAEASKEASEIEKKVNEKNAQDVLSLNESNNQVEPVIEEPTQSTEQEVNLAQSQTGGEGGTEQTGGGPPL